MSIGCCCANHTVADARCSRRKRAAGRRFVPPAGRIGHPDLGARRDPEVWCAREAWERRTSCRRQMLRMGNLSVEPSGEPIPPGKAGPQPEPSVALVAGNHEDEAYTQGACRPGACRPRDRASKDDGGGSRRRQTDKGDGKKTRSILTGVRVAVFTRCDTPEER